jgi:hypothetical protein
VHVANQPVGHVVGADFLFEDQEADMQMTGVLLREVDQDIRLLDDGTEDGKLLARLCATIFLISRLPRETGADAGIRATADTLADLVVTDLLAGSLELRRHVEESLEALVEQGKLQKVEDEYRIQTREGQEWESEFRRRETAIRGEAARVAGIRGDLLRKGIESAAGTLRVQQGKSNETRTLALHFGKAPPTADDKIPVRVRDGWNVGEGAVRSDASNAGADDATLYLYLPKRSADELTRAIATSTAADEVLNARAVVTDEAREARLAMQHRRDAAQSRLEGVIEDVVGAAIVLKGGGTVVSGASLRDSLLQAGRDAAVRLYPRFADADHTGWGTVVRRAGDGNIAALEAVDFKGDPKTHPVCRAILEFIGAGKKGSEIRTKFAAAPYGWGKDAVDGSVLTLLAAEVLGAKTDGVPTTAKQLTLPKIGVTTFTVESSRVPSVEERAAFRAICQLVGVGCKSGEEAATSSALLHVLIDLGRAAGGPAPLPEPPATIDLEEQHANSGNERVIELAAMSDLKSGVQRWLTLRDAAAARTAAWQLAQRLVAHGDPMDDANAAAEQLAAIEAERSLLNEPDPLVPVLQALAAALRDALTKARDAVATTRAEARSTIAAAEGWSSLAEPDRDQILRNNDLLDPPILAVGSDEELLASLDRQSLSGWASQLRAVSAALEDALLELARRTEPEARRVRLPSATLKTSEDVDAYVTDVRNTLEAELDSGPIVVS